LELSHWNLRDEFSLRQASTLIAGYDPNIHHVHDSTIAARRDLYETELVDVAFKMAMEATQLAAKLRDLTPPQRRVPDSFMEVRASRLPSVQLRTHFRDWEKWIERSQTAIIGSSIGVTAEEELRNYVIVFQQLAERVANVESMELTYSRAALGAWCSLRGVRSGYTFTGDIEPAVNWDKWRHMPTLQIWEAIALSLGLAPEWLKARLVLHEATARACDPNAHWANAFRDRLEVGQRNIGRGQALYNARANCYPNGNNCEVDASVFVTWAVSLPWEMPPELVKLGATIKPDVGAHEAKNTPVAQTAPAIAQGRTKAHYLKVIPGLLSQAKISKSEATQQVLAFLESNGQNSIDREALHQTLKDANGLRT
jgi:hypothetical protein